MISSNRVVKYIIAKPHFSVPNAFSKTWLIALQLSVTLVNNLYIEIKNGLVKCYTKLNGYLDLCGTGTEFYDIH